MEEIQLSVVIACYNAASTIQVQLDALAAQVWSEPWEVIVVDNQSDDDSISIVQQYVGKIPNLRIVGAYDRRGRPYARNVGVQAAKGDCIAFCDADDEVGAGWLAAMGRALGQFDCVACGIDFDKLNSRTSAMEHAYHEQRYGLQKAWYPPYFYHAGGGTIGVKRALHDRIGGFDDAFPVLEDTHYCLKVQNAGSSIQFVKDAVVHYRCRKNLSAAFSQIREWALYNVLLAKMCRQEETAVRNAWKEFSQNWIRLIALLPKTRTRLAWHKWVWYLGWQIGALQGSIKFHTRPLPLPFPPKTA